MTLLTPEAPCMPPERRRAPRTEQRQEAQEARTHAQQARQYANLWYLALLAWEVVYPRPRVPIISYHAEHAHHHGLSTLGEFLPAQASSLRLPNGDFEQGEVSQIINTMMLSSTFETSENGHLLDALRDPRQRKPESLLREDGHWVRQTSPGWALAVLSLAVHLRDEIAERYIGYCRREFERACASDVD